MASWKRSWSCWWCSGWIPKSTHRDRIAENIDVVDFELTDEQLAAIDGLDTGRRGGPDPSDITLANFGRPIPEN